MKSPSSKLPLCLRHGRNGVLLGLAFLFLAGGVARAYDPPEIGPGLFSADGVFLNQEDRSSLLEALAAIGSNFSGNAGVDDDLREKSLALALRLDPLHVHSRVAHRELAKGATPPPTDFFDTLASVSETLWTIGNRLAGPPLDPEERRLARYLLELSLLTRPEPPADRLETFAAVCDGQAPEWGTAVRLQHDTNRSTERAFVLFRESGERLREKRRETAVAMRADPPGGAATSVAPAAGPGKPPARPPRPADRPQIEPVTVSLATVRQVVGVEASPVAGSVSLTLRGPANSVERERLQESAASSTLPLIPSAEDLILNAFSLPTTALPGRSWTAGAVGEVRFTPAVEPPGPRRLLRADALLPAFVLAESVLSKNPVNADFVLLGEVSPDTLQIEMPGDALSSFAAAAALGRPYVLVPAKVGESLVAFLQKSNQLELLFQTELIAYTDAIDVRSRLTTPTDPALISASAIFKEIREVSLRPDPATRVALPDLAKIPSAQGKLRDILVGFPAHLSAWAMLEYGTRPVTSEILLSQFAARIDQIVAPFLIFENLEEDFNGLDGIFDQSDAQFLKLRVETPLEARSLLGSAEDLVEAAERYLELTNKTSSIAEQRLREVQAALAAFKAERSRLGLESASSL
jgi:hypothetical protein